MISNDDVANLSLKKISGRIGDLAPKGLKNLALSMQARDVGMFDGPDARVLIESGFDARDAHGGSGCVWLGTGNDSAAVGRGR